MRVLVPLLVSASLRSTLSSCSVDSITTLSRGRCFERLIFCAVDPYFIDPAACLNQLPESMSKSIESSGTDCTACLEDFVGAIANHVDLVMPACATNARDRGCLNNDHIQTSLSIFEACSGYSLIYPACSRSEIRLHQEEGGLLSILTNVLNNVDEIPTFPDLSAGCGSCFGQLYQMLKTSNSDRVNSQNLHKCLTSSLQHPDCMASLSSHLRFFEKCAGFPIDRTGPECDESELRSIAILKPYDNIIQCSYKPEFMECSDYGNFLSDLGALCSRECSECFVEFAEKIMSTKAVFSAVSTCDDVHSNSCTSRHAAELSDLERCTSR